MDVPPWHLGNNVAFYMELQRQSGQLLGEGLKPLPTRAGRDLHPDSGPARTLPSAEESWEKA